MNILKAGFRFWTPCKIQKDYLFKSQNYLFTR